MVELPEAKHLATQLNQTVAAQTVQCVEAAHTPHVWAWYSGDPSLYPARLEGKQVMSSEHWGGFVVLHLSEDARLLFGEGTSLRWFPSGTALPAKHQLLLDLGTGSLVASVQMYGFMLLEEGAEPGNPYARTAQLAPSPLVERFDLPHFRSLRDSVAGKTVSLKGFLATEQRIPGLGNGVLQDILFEAELHPRRKLESLAEEEFTKLYCALKATLNAMVAAGGRDTESDLFGNHGRYHTKVSRLTLGKPCPRCGSHIVKKAYMGGNVYTCPNCQRA